MASEKPKAPDFNDEFIKFGLESFRDRLRLRLNQAYEKKTGIDKEISPAAAVDETASHLDGGPDTHEADDPTDSWQRLFLMGNRGPLGCSYNMSLIFENDPDWAGVFAENLFTFSIDILKQPPIPEIKIGDLEDNSVAMIHIWVEQNYQIVIADAAMKKALINIAAKNRYHPVQDYLKSLPVWDGKPRTEYWLRFALGAGSEAFTADERDAPGFKNVQSERAPDVYLRAVGKMFLIGAVRRIMDAPDPTKVDNMLIFEGIQGEGKSSLIEVLFSPWAGDTPLPLGDKDAYIAIRGYWGYEMAEMDSFNKAAVTTAKSFLSSHTDNYRPPFGTKNVKFSRQTVFIGSTNHYEYLTDSSGNRRYWPVTAKKVDLVWLKENKEQLWSEALHHYHQGVRHWVDKKASAEERELSRIIDFEQSLREHPDAWEALMFSWMNSGQCREEHYSSNELLTNNVLFDMDIRSVTKQHEMKLSNALQKLEWTKTRKRMAGYPVAKPYLYSPPKWAKDRHNNQKTDRERDESNEMKF